MKIEKRVYFSAQNEQADKIKSHLLEAIYMFSKSVDKRKKSRSLPKLITNGMDDESIWQQLELQNEEEIQTSIKNVSKFLAASTDKFKLGLGDFKDDDNEDKSEDDEAIGEELVDEGDEEESEAESGLDSEIDESGSEENSAEPTKRKRALKKSIVDDQFFKLSEMEEFLLREDERAMNPNMEDHVNVDVDLFAADETNREESLKYADFFDDGQEDYDEEEKENDEETITKPEEPKSSHEMMQERLQKKIENIENKMLDDKPWQMKGEVKADNRPQNSLLEEILEFDSTTRPAPIITEEVTKNLEDIIKQRIKDKVFDDVERKVKPSDIRIEYKKQLVLDQEKSKQSLAQIYEKEFVKELEKKNEDEEEPEEPKEHKEIRADLKDLFEKLDLLSNFYYTPRPAQPELKIITNLPTITMEEVAPVAVSEAAMLAPEEIKRKSRGDIIGAGERTRTDKNRERRHKKVFQREKSQKQTIGGAKLMEKVVKSRNVEKVNIKH